jgi:hypothetical protein
LIVRLTMVFGPSHPWVGSDESDWRRRRDGVCECSSFVLEHRNIMSPDDLQL